MSRRRREPPALTGPAAAAQLGLDGFRDLPWKSLWCVPMSQRGQPGTIRTRLWFEPITTGDLVIAHPIQVIRNLGDSTELMNQPDKLQPLDRIELAVEHALRDHMVEIRALRETVMKGRTLGDELVRQVLSVRGDEPPAESYAEVRMHQWLRALGIFAWRQVPVFERVRLKHRVDALVPFDPRAPRPAFVAPESGLIVEVDSRKYHEGAFEQDHERQTTYDALGLAWISFTPNQIERSPARAQAALERRLASAGRSRFPRTRQVRTKSKPAGKR